MEIVREMSRGAESVIYECRIFGVKCVLKRRLSKPYRYPILDLRINRERTLQESRIMLSALEAGADVPALLYVEPPSFSIFMEYLEGPTLMESLMEGKMDAKFLGNEVGKLVGILHSSGIVHGDLNTKNFLVVGTDVFVIDFGLAKRSFELEDLGVDVHVFMRSLESVHPAMASEVLHGFSQGYDNVTGSWDKVREKVTEIRRRGRYVRERKAKYSIG
ncbi:Kae1-associated kinase Bud32 [Sulfodiicoccus acidiphilus]|uniref:non-specific serine/threonine protein kinase n=1 Tax=Sulfodiicoccus acidiphilus TaxID=1670455 RepID=A0A348B764_9CREN|nr:Kae1-associated kinase Bud32 [Sulfodiicoccus acidiphilus]BBD74016.1 Kae1-associated kinase Bud32 [Sulfodiicoccus acidiphilus]GGT87143.1 Kae1-associated kinase Bud32 [Sulfodiicoccus acidiphilus]